MRRVYGGIQGCRRGLGIMDGGRFEPEILAFCCEH